MEVLGGGVGFASSTVDILFCLKKHSHMTKLTLQYSTHITQHHSTDYITEVIGLITSTFVLLMLTVRA